MSAAVVRDIITKSMTDEEFRHALEVDPATTLADFELTRSEREALASGDEDAILETAEREATAAYVVAILSPNVKP